MTKKQQPQPQQKDNTVIAATPATTTTSQGQQGTVQTAAGQTNTITLNNEEFNKQNIQKTKAEGQQKQQQAKDINNAEAIPKDNNGNVNVSRGIIGLKTEEDLQPEAAYITDGTVADFVYPPSIFPSKRGTGENPITEEDLQKRIDNERQKAGMDYARQEQIAIKLRTEMQGFEYKPPAEFANDPELAPTQIEYQKKEPSVDGEQGEQVIDVDEDQAEDEQVIAAEPQENQQDNIKG